MSQVNTSSGKPALTDTPIPGALGFGHFTVLTPVGVVVSQDHHPLLSVCLGEVRDAVSFSLGMNAGPQLNYFLIVGLGLDFKPQFSCL